jgi:hypothetical protein
MKISSLVNLIVDAEDVLDFFSDKETGELLTTPDQLISRLDLLKRKGSSEFLLALEGLRSSTSAAMADTIETSGTIDGPVANEGDDDDLQDLDAALADIENEGNLDEPTTETQNPTATVDAEKAKNGG